MSPIARYFWLAEQAVGGLLFVWPITMVLGIFVIVAFVVAARDRSLTLRSFSWAMLPIVVPAVLLLWGVIFARTGRDTWQAYAVFVLWLAQLPVAAFAIKRAVGSRLVASAMAAFISYYSVWVAFVAGMSVTNDWL